MPRILYPLMYKMQNYSCKTQTKNGRRRRKQKQTKRKFRHGRKSMKVMRGGAIYKTVVQLKALFETKENEELKQQLFTAFNVTNLDEMWRLKLKKGKFNTKDIADELELGPRGHKVDSDLVILLRSAAK